MENEITLEFFAEIGHTPDTLAASLHETFLRDYSEQELDAMIGGQQGIKEKLLQGVPVYDFFKFIYDPVPKLYF